MAEKGSPEEFHDYRRWVCSHVDSLLCGDPVFWEQFGSRRSRLRNAPDPIGARFNWERSFLERPVGKEPISRRELAAATSARGCSPMPSPGRKVTGCSR